MATATATQNRPIYEIAREIKNIWRTQGKGIYFGAASHLDALLSIDKPTDIYISESGKWIAAYFLANAATFKGEDAKRLKLELKKVCGIK
jgi:hypothetical protein